MSHAPALLELLADGHPRETAELAAALGIDRAGLAAEMAECVALDAPLEHGADGRLRLPEPWEPLRREAVLAALPEGVAPPELEILARIDSTNAHLLERADGTPRACLAERQEAGRGRAGRPWYSPYGRNLYLSLARRFADGAAAGAGLSLALGVAVVEELGRLGIGGVGLKWPNDLLWEGCKLGGLLVEARLRPQGAADLVLGLGLNLRMPPAAAERIDQPWADLRMLPGGRGLSRNRLAGRMIGALTGACERFEAEGLAPFRERWNRYDVLAGREVTLDQADGRRQGRAVGIDGRGALLLEHDGRVEAILSGDTRLRASR